MSDKALILILVLGCLSTVFAVSPAQLDKIFTETVQKSSSGTRSFEEFLKSRQKRSSTLRLDKIRAKIARLTGNRISSFQDRDGKLASHYKKKLEEKLGIVNHSRDCRECYYHGIESCKVYSSLKRYLAMKVQAQIKY